MAAASVCIYTGVSIKIFRLCMITLYNLQIELKSHNLQFVKIHIKIINTNISIEIYAYQYIEGEYAYIQ